MIILYFLAIIKKMKKIKIIKQIKNRSHKKEINFKIPIINYWFLKIFSFFGNNLKISQ
jgi:hypothetical protein